MKNKKFELNFVVKIHKQMRLSGKNRCFWCKMIAKKVGNLYMAGRKNFFVRPAGQRNIPESAAFRDVNADFQLMRTFMNRLSTYQDTAGGR